MPAPPAFRRSDAGARSDAVNFFGAENKKLIIVNKPCANGHVVGRNAEGRCTECKRLRRARGRRRKGIPRREDFIFCGTTAPKTAKHLDKWLAAGSAAWVSRGYRGRGKPALVYVIAADRWCKIGVTGNLAKRLDSIRTHCPIPVTVAYTTEVLPRAVASWIELTTHRGLVDRCSNGGEWFEISAAEAKSAVQLAELFA